MNIAETLQRKWAPILEHKDLNPIKDAHRKAVTAVLLENTEKAIRESNAHGAYQVLSEAPTNVPFNAMGASSSTAGAGPFDLYDPILISLVRRAMPNLLAYDICGVQPMTGPTGLIFAMRARYGDAGLGNTSSHGNTKAGTETFYNEVNTAFSTVVTGANTFGQKHVGTYPGTSSGGPLTSVNTYNTGTGMSRSQAEALGADANTAYPQMGFSIEKVTVEAKSRALKAEYTLELAQDLKAIHGLDAEAELANILSAEILAEINREVVRTINITAVQGAAENTTTPGVFDLDTDSNGRWLVEKFKGLMFQLEREANRIARDTRRGKGNIVICTSDVASALQAAGVLDYAPALAQNNLEVDDTGTTFVGVLNGRLRVYIDPYASGGQYMTVGYKGSSPFDAGLFYCPYIPLQMVRAVDPGNFAPKIAFKTRYGMVANPFAEGATVGNGQLAFNTNVYYRRVVVRNLM
jgi:hypothetical protein